jgi:hypothetical protein
MGFTEFPGVAFSRMTVASGALPVVLANAAYAGATA